MIENPCLTTGSMSILQVDRSMRLTKAKRLLTNMNEQTEMHSKKKMKETTTVRGQKKRDLA